MHIHYQIRVQVVLIVASRFLLLFKILLLEKFSSVDCNGTGGKRVLAMMLLDSALHGTTNGFNTLSMMIVIT